MSALVRSILLGVMALILSATAIAAELTPDEEARAREIGKSLRCVVCQNQPIEDSNAPLAADMRQLVRERIAAGESDEQIVDHLVDRYGSFVLLKPPFRLDTYMLWFGPLIFVIIGALGCLAYLRSRQAYQPPEELSAEEAGLIRHRLQAEGDQ